MHLFVDISGHGYGHLAISAPVLNALAEICPELRLTVRSSLPAALLAERIVPPLELIPGASDFGFVMHDAPRVDLAASAAAYHAAHATWPERVASEARLLTALRPDMVLSNISYLPLAGAAQAGLPAMAICSLNWADLFAHYFAAADWAQPIHAQMLAAYRSAQAFLRVQPAMPMTALANVVDTGIVAASGRAHDLGLAGERAVLVAMGGIAYRLPLEDWPRLPGVRWLVPASWDCRHPDALASESFGLPFTDLLCSVDAVIGKPGYGTFTEAACNGIPVLYRRREDWPEQEFMIDWLNDHGVCREISAWQLRRGDLAADLQALWTQAAPARPLANGAHAAARRIRAAAVRSA